MQNQRLKLSVLVIAVQSALGVMFSMPLQAYAVDDEVAALINPTNTAEVGLESSSVSSAKYGEYNGLNKAENKLIGNFNIRGGDTYNQGSGLTRWEIKGNDLGTTSRDVRADLSSQGQWNLGIGYDQLQHNITDTYQLPFVGTMGGNSFRLPLSYGVINTTALSNVTAGSTTQAVGTRNLNGTQLGAFQTVDVNSTRQNSSFTAGYIFNPRWNVKFDFNHLEQSGAKLIAASSSDARTGAGAAGTWAKEAMVTLMNPTNYRTDTFNLAANWTGNDAFMTASYVASYFRNSDDRLSWDNPLGTGSNTTGIVSTTLGGGYQPNMLSVAPGNDFYQLNLSGGFNLSPTRKLTGGLSVGRNTQNDNYLVDLMQAGGLPRTSLDGVVMTTNANLKLTDQTTKDLALSAGIKYNVRDNQTGSSVYKFIDLGGVNRIAINTPYSNSKTALDLAGDYRIDKRQNLRVSYDHEEIQRWCDNVAGASTVGTTGVITSAPSPAGAGCVAVPHSTEDKLGVNYRLKFTEDLNYSIGYGYSQRVAAVDHNYISPLMDNSGTTVNYTGIVNSADYKGYMAYFDASRNQNLVKAGASWQANEQLSFSVNGRYTIDQYIDSTLGVQNGHSLGVNLDTAYAYSESGTITAYFSTQDRDRSMLSGASGNGANSNVSNYANSVAPTNVFRNVMTDAERTLGLNIKQSGFMGGKLELVGDVSLTIGQTQYSTEVPYYVPTTTAPLCSSAASLSCGATPAIFSNTLQAKITGKYQVDKKSKVIVGYQYQRLITNDYYYNALQYGYSTSTAMPTNQQQPDYTVNTISAAYVYNF